MTFFGFWILGSSNKLFFTNENQLGFHMWYHLFLHYGWFLQNLGKDFIRTNMHTTVSIGSFTIIRVKLIIIIIQLLLSIFVCIDSYSFR